MIERRIARSFLPSTGVLELTYRCSHQCLFCSCPWEAPGGEFDQRSELTTKQWKSSISTLCSRGVSNLALTGGEALLREDISEIIEYAASCETEHIETIDGKLVSSMAPPHLYILSNGDLVNPSILEMCKKYNVQLSLSLPGLETYEKQTGVDGADHVLQMFSAARDLDLPTVANITVTRLNLYELRETIAAALLAGADQLLLNRFLPGGRGLSYADELSLSADEVRSMLKIADDTLSLAGRQGSLGTELPKCVADPAEYKHLQVSTRCSAGRQFFVIGPSGYIRVCNHSPVRLTHIDDLPELKNNEYWTRFTQKDYLPDQCGDCVSRFECDGGLQRSSSYHWRAFMCS